MHDLPDEQRQFLVDIADHLRATGSLPDGLVVKTVVENVVETVVEPCQHAGLIARLEAVLRG
jgi:hypothetical protein